MTDDERIALQLIRLNLETAIKDLSGSIASMDLNIWPTITLPLARREITRAVNDLDALLSAAVQ